MLKKLLCLLLCLEFAASVLLPAPAFSLAPSTSLSPVARAEQLLNEIEEFYRAGNDIYRPLLDKLYCTDLHDGELAKLSASIPKELCDDIIRTRKSVKSFPKSIERIRNYCRAVLKATDEMEKLLSPSEEGYSGSVEHLENAVRGLTLLQTCLDAYQTFKKLARSKWDAAGEQYQNEMAPFVIKMRHLAFALSAAYEDEFGAKKKAMEYLGLVMQTIGEKEITRLDPREHAEIILRLIPLLNDVTLPGSVIELLKKFDPAYFNGQNQTPEKTISALFAAEKNLEKSFPPNRIPSLIQCWVYAKIFSKDFAEARALIEASRTMGLSETQQLKFAFPAGILLIQEAEHFYLKDADTATFRKKMEEAVDHFVATKSRGWSGSEIFSLSLEGYCRVRLGEFDPSQYERARLILKHSTEPDEEGISRDPLLYANYALACWHTGHVEEAFEAVRQMLFLNPFKPDAYFKLFDFYSTAGLIDPAYTAFKRAYRLSNGDDQHLALFFHFIEPMRGTAVALLAKLLGDPELGEHAEKTLAAQIFKFPWYGVHERQARPILTQIADEEKYSVAVRERARRLIESGEQYWRPAPASPAPTPETASSSKTAPASAKPTPAIPGPATPEAPAQKHWILEALEQSPEKILEDFILHLKTTSPTVSSGWTANNKTAAQREIDKLTHTTTASAYRRMTPRERASHHFSIMHKTFNESSLHTARGYAQIVDSGNTILEKYSDFFAFKPVAIQDPQSYAASLIDLLYSDDANTFWYVFAQSVQSLVEHLYQAGMFDKARLLVDEGLRHLDRILEKNPEDLQHGLNCCYVWYSLASLCVWKAVNFTESEEERRALFAKGLQTLETGKRLLDNANRAIPKLQDPAAVWPTPPTAEQKQRVAGLVKILDNTPENLKRLFLELEVRIYQGQRDNEKLEVAAQNLVSLPAPDTESFALLHLKGYEALKRHEEAVRFVAALVEKKGKTFTPGFNIMKPFADHLVAANKPAAALVIYSHCLRLIPESPEALFMIYSILTSLIENPHSREALPFHFEKMLVMTHPQYLDAAMSKLLFLASQQPELFRGLIEKAVTRAGEPAAAALERALQSHTENLPRILLELKKIKLVQPNPKIKGEKGRQAQEEFRRGSDRLQRLQRIAGERMREEEQKEFGSVFERLSTHWPLWPNLTLDKIRRIVSVVCREQKNARPDPDGEEFLSLDDKILDAVTSASIAQYAHVWLPKLKEVFESRVVEEAAARARSVLLVYGHSGSEKMSYAKIKESYLAETVRHCLFLESEFLEEEELVFTEDLAKLLKTEDGGNPDFEQLQQKINALLIERLRIHFPFYAEKISPEAATEILRKPRASREETHAALSQRNGIEAIRIEPREYLDPGFYLVIRNGVEPAHATLCFPPQRPVFSHPEVGFEPKPLTRQESILAFARHEDEVLEILQKRQINTAVVEKVSSNLGPIQLFENDPRWSAWRNKEGKTAQARTSRNVKELTVLTLDKGKKVRSKLPNGSAFYNSYLFSIPGEENFFMVRLTPDELFDGAFCGTGEEILHQILGLSKGYDRLQILEAVRGRRAEELFFKRLGGQDALVFKNANGYFSLDISSLVLHGKTISEIIAPYDGAAASLQNISFLLEKKAKPPTDQPHPHTNGNKAHLPYNLILDRISSTRTAQSRIEESI